MIFSKNLIFKKIKLLIISVLAASLLIGCKSKSTQSSKTTLSGTVNLSPIYMMLVYEGSGWDKNESILPSNYVYTDINGNYSIIVNTGSKVTIVPTSFTKVIATQNDVLNPIMASVFNDKYFTATSKSSNDIIIMSDSKKQELGILTPTQLKSLYNVSEQNDIFDLGIVDKISYKEIRDAQDYAMKTILREYIFKSNNKKDNDTIESVDSFLTSIIIKSWLEASKENNISINNINVLEGIVSSVITKYNAQDYLYASNKISFLDGTDKQLKSDISIVLKAIANKGLELNNDITKLRQLYAGVLSTKFTNTLKGTASLIHTDLVGKAQKNKSLSQLLYSAYINSFVEGE
jgi:hypothetical protein